MKVPKSSSDDVIGVGYRHGGILQNATTSKKANHNSGFAHVRTTTNIYDDNPATGLPDSPPLAGPDGLSLYSATEKTGHVVDVRDVTYTVREWQGSWWKGCCVRERKDKQVLRDVNVQVRSGQLTAVLGNSGIY